MSDLIMYRHIFGRLDAGTIMESVDSHYVTAIVHDGERDPRRVEPPDRKPLDHARSRIDVESNAVQMSGGLLKVFLILLLEYRCHLNGVINIGFI